ncbi:MAG: hypothetical protein JW708_10750, partial [Vallitaleaceae bacterium]|nr:hypothetical protein [Vallitaleaceae bacterium]
DLLRVVPRFYYVPIESGIINMSKRQEVDLYLADYSTMTKINKDFILNGEDRSLIGSRSIPNASAVGVSENLRNASRQLFSGSFFLENNTYAVPKGTEVLNLKNFDVDKEPFLKQGYILVNFEIEAYKNVSDSSNLSGLKPVMTYSVGWEEDGYVLSQGSISLSYGDIIFYSTDRRASQTYQ